MYDTDEEQVEALKRWWHEYGNMAIVGVLLAIAVYSGITWYQHSARTEKHSASDSYQEMLKLGSATGNDEKIKSLAEGLKKDYQDSAYAVFAAMEVARLAVDNGRLDDALVQLNWAREHNKDEALDRTLRLRTARIQLAQGKADEAFSTISVKEGEQVASFEELRGDIYLAQNKPDNARTSYTLAKTDAEAKGLQRPLLDMKLNDLAK